MKRNARDCCSHSRTRLTSSQVCKTFLSKRQLVFRLLICHGICIDIYYVWVILVLEAFRVTGLSQHIGITAYLTNSLSSPLHTLLVFKYTQLQYTFTACFNVLGCDGHTQPPWLGIIMCQTNWRTEVAAALRVLGRPIPPLPPPQRPPTRRATATWTTCPPFRCTDDTRPPTTNRRPTRRPIANIRNKTGHDALSAASRTTRNATTQVRVTIVFATHKQT